MAGSMSRKHRVAAVGVAALALLAACSTSSKTSGKGMLGVGSPSAVAGSPTAAATPTGTSTTPPATPTATSTHAPAPVSHPYPSDYPAAILSAWANSDWAYLSQLTNAATSSQIRGYGNINRHWTLVISDGAMGSTYSSYYNNGGDEIILRVVNAEVAAHHWHAGSVEKWDQMRFPSDATGYAKEYVDGWVFGNRARMDLLGTTALTSYLTAKPTPAADYTLDPPFNTGPSEMEVEVKDSTTSLDISLIIDTTKLGHQHAIGGCDIGC